MYTGITTDINRREQEHNSSDKGAKYTKIRRPVKIVFSSSVPDRSEASKLEIKIKKLKKSEKLLLIQAKRDLP
ncbi:MAG: GIY-YIG nuclease family protein [Candidatus Gracilibacteria bacterium]|nr:GIY-YIG nuclease family protein [Candidatus Gracilibacteria bacterium]